MSHFWGGPPGWTDMDRLLAMARKHHDAEVCQSGAGPVHYRDECDEDSEHFTDPQPEVVESTCAWLAAAEEYAEEAGKAQVRERGLMISWRDGSAGPLDRPGDKRDHGKGQARDSENRNQRDLDGGPGDKAKESSDDQQ